MPPTSFSKKNRFRLRNQKYYRMRKIFIVVAISIVAFSGARANEGMWLPLLIKRLNHVDMQKHGLQLTAEEIYSVNNSSLKDAIVRLGRGFCTGEMISAEGLMLTNHHCGFDAIQENSTPEHNYLADGFHTDRYNEVLETIKAERGQLSDDGDRWIDKLIHSR